MPLIDAHGTVVVNGDVEAVDITAVVITADLVNPLKEQVKRRVTKRMTKIDRKRMRNQEDKDTTVDEEEDAVVEDTEAVVVIVEDTEVKPLKVTKTLPMMKDVKEKTLKEETIAVEEVETDDDHVDSAEDQEDHHLKVPGTKVTVIIVKMVRVVTTKSVARTVKVAVEVNVVDDPENLSDPEIRIMVAKVIPKEHQRNKTNLLMINNSSKFKLNQFITILRRLVHLSTIKPSVRIISLFNYSLRYALTTSS